MKTLENMNNFKEQCKSIENKIMKLSSSKYNSLPISDGVINHNEYLNAKYKILWILKEPYGDNGGWSLPDAINEKKSWNEQPASGRPTFKPMILTSYSILNNFLTYKNIPDIKSEEVFGAFKKIAYINVKKFPNIQSISNPKAIRDAYKENKDILLKQIDLYNPDIIIGGYTLHHFLNDLQINPTNVLKDNVAHFIKDKKLFIRAYHPSARINKENYCNQIIMTAKQWAENKLQNI